MQIDPQVVMNLSVDFLKRNNPVEQIKQEVTDTWRLVTTMPAQRNLLNFELMMAQEEFGAMMNAMNDAATSGKPEPGTQFNVTY